MNKINWGLSGIYDARTFSYLQRKGVKRFSFDFRPRSMNFLQHHRFFEMLEDYYQGDHLYFLHFENEKDFVIKKFLQDVANFLDDDLLKNQFFLYFSDVQETKYYEQFNIPFYWHYQENNHLSNLIRSPLFKGPIISYLLLESYFYEGTLHGFLQHLSTYLVGSRLPIIVAGHWQMEIIPEIFYYRSFESFWLPIDREVESNYRSVDFIKLEQQWKRLHGIERLVLPYSQRPQI